MITIHFLLYLYEVKINEYKKLVKNRENINSLMKIFSFIPDEPYLKLMYRLRMGKN